MYSNARYGCGGDTNMTVKLMNSQKNITMSKINTSCQTFQCKHNV